MTLPKPVPTKTLQNTAYVTHVMMMMPPEPLLAYECQEYAPKAEQTNFENDDDDDAPPPQPLLAVG